MTWVAVAIGGSALIGAAASSAGAKKQADASKKASKQQMAMFETLNQQQQPYIQSGYGALGKLNTLMGIGARPQTNPAGQWGIPTGGLTVNNGPTGPGVKIPPRVEMGQQAMGIPANATNLSLRKILTMRAQNGDTEAARILGSV